MIINDQGKSQGEGKLLQLALPCGRPCPTPYSVFGCIVGWTGFGRKWDRLERLRNDENCTRMVLNLLFRFCRTGFVF